MGKVVAAWSGAKCRVDGDAGSPNPGLRFAPSGLCLLPRRSLDLLQARSQEAACASSAMICDLVDVREKGHAGRKRKM